MTVAVISLLPSFEIIPSQCWNRFSAQRKVISCEIPSRLVLGRWKFHSNLSSADLPLASANLHCNHDSSSLQISPSITVINDPIIIEMKSLTLNLSDCQGKSFFLPSGYRETLSMQTRRSNWATSKNDREFSIIVHFPCLWVVQSRPPSVSFYFAIREKRNEIRKAN